MVTDLGKFLRKLRTDNNERQADMAYRLGYHQTSLSYIERGNRKITSQLEDNIIKRYRLNEEQIKEFKKVIFKTELKKLINSDIMMIDNRNDIVLLRESLNEVFDRLFKHIEYNI